MRLLRVTIVMRLAQMLRVPVTVHQNWFETKEQRARKDAEEARLSAGAK